MSGATGGRDDGASHPPPGTPPSSRVRLEEAFLEEGPVLEARPGSAGDEGRHTCVLIVAAEPDVRRYLIECLRERRDLRIFDAASVRAGVVMAYACLPDFLLVDGPEREVVVTLSTLPAILIVDDPPREAAAPGARLRLLPRPFSAGSLLAEVGRLIG